MAAEVQWFFPRELSEVPSLLAQEGVVPHGGGTGLLLGGMSQVRGLVDLSRLGLGDIRKDGASACIGAAASYAAAAAAAAAWEPRHVLARSLSAAANTPLRNRITVGGSIALFPYWSDLVGPLLALEAEVHLVGSHEGWLPLPEYLARREPRRGSLITEVRWEEQGWVGEYRRWTRTRTDRPAFSLVAVGRRSRKRSSELRVVLVGCSGRHRRLTEVEEAVAAGEEPAAAAARAQIEIPARMGFSGTYLSHCARVELERALSALRANGSGAEDGT
ncbi:MAG: FAD binding domain-containing protein [Spirochaetales bacterium]|nr:FAD binding domain-containing protein [Spirochaetales bacterium]